MKVYVVLSYDEDENWFFFESFLGVFLTREKAENFIANDCDEYDSTKPRHDHYEIREITLDK